jgi:hypothetical protein
VVEVGVGELAVGLGDAFGGFFVGGDGLQGVDPVRGEPGVVASMVCSATAEPKPGTWTGASIGWMPNLPESSPMPR